MLTLNIPDLMAEITVKEAVTNLKIIFNNKRETCVFHVKKLTMGIFSDELLPPSNNTEFLFKKGSLRNTTQGYLNTGEFRKRKFQTPKINLFRCLPM